MSAEIVEEILRLAERLTPEERSKVAQLLTQHEQIEADENDTEANFRRGWHEAITGQTRPISELWSD